MPSTVRFVLCVLLLGLAGALRADVQPHGLFRDGAVLQQGSAIPVWGTGDDGEAVSVTLDGRTVNTTVAGGRWRVTLPPHAAGGPYELRIQGRNAVTVRNVMVGEVWICAGQSNMFFMLKGADSAAEELPKADHPGIRMFIVTGNASIHPQTEVSGAWAVCTPASAAGFSAVGYFFARDLHRARGVPIGLIQAAVSGSPGQAWMSLAALEQEPELAKYLTTIRDLTAKAPDAPPSAGAPTILFNGKIAPLIPYAIRGVIWYQGESNGGKEYRTLFPRLISDWRDHWGQGTFPFLFVQIAPYKDQKPEIREAQLLAWKKVPNTAMVVTTDVGDSVNIHPKRKEPVGVRLALAARGMVYGEAITYSGPVFESLKIEGSNAVAKFLHTGSGLEARDGPLRGFEIAGVDGKFVPADAQIRADTVVLSNPAVIVPVAIRYGWSNVPDVNLYNREGLPASPFRSQPPD